MFLIILILLTFFSTVADGKHEKNNNWRGPTYNVTRRSHLNVRFFLERISMWDTLANVCRNFRKNAIYIKWKIQNLFKETFSFTELIHSDILLKVNTYQSAWWNSQKESRKKAQNCTKGILKFIMLLIGAFRRRGNKHESRKRGNLKESNR